MARHLPTDAPTLAAVRRALRAAADPTRAKVYQWFFKTGQGEYGEGDRFAGIRVPQLRLLARANRTLPRVAVLELLHDPIHEHRLLALLIWTLQYRAADESGRERIVADYLANTASINNWDLVDLSAYHILGPADPNGRGLLPRLAESTSLWERRMAIVATMHHLRQGNVRPTFAIAGRLVDDEHDLIHKATGWLLREAGKVDRRRLEAFLVRHGPGMPRTMLRYAIERFSAADRAAILRAMPPARRRRPR